MARGKQHLKRRPQANARVTATPAEKAKAAKRVKHQRWEDELFFSRLRNHAKGIFWLLIVVFAVGFVLFGVGSGSTGVSDALQNFFTRSSASGSSISKIQKKTTKDPKLAQPWKDLSVAFAAKDRLDESIDAQKHYTELRPKDHNGLETLASLYSRRVTELQQIYSDVRTRTSILAPSNPSSVSSTSDLGKALASLTNPISTAVSGVVGGDASNVYIQIITLAGNEVTTYKQVAKLAPKDAPTQLRLAQIAQSTGDTKTAISAYEAFLKLAPDDPTVPFAKKAIKQLKAQLAASATPATKSK